MMRWIVLAALMVACGNKEEVYQACEVADDCAVPDETEAVCLEKADEGYCSWLCEADSDCAGNEEEDGYNRVCASFESNDAMYCFPACEEGDDGEEVCPEGFGCRSTGGGNDNRKVCFPSE